MLVKSCFLVFIKKFHNDLEKFRNDVEKFHNRFEFFRIYFENFHNDFESFRNVFKNTVKISNERKRATNEYSDIYFDFSTSLTIIEKAISILKYEPAVLQIDTKLKQFQDFVIIGDIHGSLDSLIRIFKEKGFPPSTRYLFLGDYVDRGTRSCEVVILLYSLKCMFPNDVFLMRGNHEFKRICDIYGFKNECTKRMKKLSDAEKFYNCVVDSFELMPICAILDDSIFCVYGGITSHVKNRDELLAIKKVGKRLLSNETAQSEMLWNDPDKFTNNYKSSKRGKGSIFGENDVQSFLKNLNFSLIIRGHQNVFNGYDWPFGQKGGILTVFSAIDYCKSSNKGGIAIILKEIDIENHQLVTAHHFEKNSKLNDVNNCLSYPLDINEECYL